MATRKRSNRTASAASNQGASPSGGRVVGGVVRKGRRGVPGCIVKAARVDVKQQTPIGSALTDRAGRYEIAYDVDALQLPAGTPLHLQVEVQSPLGERLALSDVRFDAGARELIDLQVDTSTQLSEYEQISGPVRIAAGGLAETGVSVEDVPFLLNRIEKQSTAGGAPSVVTRERVELWVDSEALAAATGLPASFF